jgi:hypothetical protein
VWHPPRLPVDKPAEDMLAFLPQQSQFIATIQSALRHSIFVRIEGGMAEVMPLLNVTTVIVTAPLWRFNSYRT